jgi:uncharacterized protein YoxC
MILVFIFACINIVLTCINGVTSASVIFNAIAICVLAISLYKQKKETADMIYEAKKTVRLEVDRMITSRIEESKKNK